MAEVVDLSKRSPRLSSVKTRSRRALSPRDSANLLAAVALMDEACDTFTALVHDTRHPALREMFTLFARTMECYAGVIRSKMRSEDEGDSPRHA
jgi:hypothetical protein